MTINRRQLLKNSLVGSAALGCLSLSACASKALSPTQHKAQNMIINGNMVISPTFGEPLDETSKAQLRQTGLTAFKQSIGGSQGTFEQTKDILDSFKYIYEANPDVFMHVNSAHDLFTAQKSNKIGIIYSFEAATMLVDDLDNIKYFADRGVRIMQPGYNNSNAFGAGVMSIEPPLGLTNLGKEAIKAMQANNVLVDLSHAHEQTAFDVLKVSQRPVGITHTACFGVNPHQRNKSDALLKAVAHQGGVVGIYEMSYLTPDLEQQSLDAFMAHIFHAINVCGTDHVGIGSDTPVLGFDTGEESMKQWNEINAMRKRTGVAAPGEGPPPYVVGLNGPHKMHGIADELIKRGMSSASVDKIIGNNFARLFKAAW
ncbi:dipeptidase [Marinicella rhabdoformis]|uniref:dipeptidase n=1 Tax=Marinicella rhabdoformis TaxID=2580566 RepID=UPI0012AEB5C1|nr:membrane dipeptidase [Marinicella rhabdoformis]